MPVIKPGKVTVELQLVKYMNIYLLHLTNEPACLALT